MGELAANAGTIGAGSLYYFVNYGAIYSIYKS
jgi:hypothetical protein